MPKASYVQEQFLGGQWSPFAQGRMSDREYKRAMRVCFNAYPIEEGAWVRRSGFKRAGPARGGTLARMMKYDFTQSQPITLEFTDSALRFWRADTIVDDGTAGLVSSVTGTDTATFVLDHDPGWSVGDHIYFTLPDAATSLHNAALKNRQFEIATYSTGSITCKDVVTGDLVKASDIAFDSGTDTLTAVHILELTTPYTPSNLGDLRLVPTDDKGDNVALVLDGVHAPQELVISGDATTFKFAPAVFSDGPYLDPMPGSLITPAATSGLVSLTLSFSAYSSTHVYNKGDVVSSSGTTYQSLQDVNLNNAPASSATYWKVVSAGISVGPSGVTTDDIGRYIRLQDSANNWTWGKITALTSSGLINPNLAGATNFGDMTSNGGLAGAFHGTTQTEANSAVSSRRTGISNAYVGKDFTGATSQSISSVTVYPPSNGGLLKQTAFTQGSQQGPMYIAGGLRLYASNSSPGSATSGTLLGSVSIPLSTSVYVGTNPITITSNDPNTAWKYVWVTFSITSFYGNLLTHNGWMECGRIDMFTSGAAQGTAFTAQIEGPALPNTTVIDTFLMGAYCTNVGYPTCGGYHEGRLWLGGAIDNRFDGSVSNDPLNFSPSQTDGSVADSNAISDTLNSSDVNPIFWFMPDLQGVLIGTQAGEWILQASNVNNPLTPTSIQAHRITKYGCANTEPVRTGLTTCFVQRYRRRLHEYLSDVFSGKFYAPNLTEYAKDITQKYVQEIAYQEELAPIVWARRGDGELAGCTYRRISMLSHEPPEFRGWHEHKHGLSGASITSISVGSDSTGNLDALTACVVDGNGTYQIEVMQKMFDEEDVLTEASFLDSYLIPAAAQITSTGVKLSGLLPMAGETLTVFAAGLDCGDRAIGSDGTVVVPFEADPDKLFTTAYCTALDYGQGSTNSIPLFDASGTFVCYLPCIVGASYTSRGQILPPMEPAQTGARTGPAFGKVTKHSGVAALLHTSVGVSFGVDFDKPLLPAIFKSRNGKGTQVLRKDQPFSGTHYLNLSDEGVSMDNALCWEVTRPYPCTVVAIGGFDGSEDR